MESDFKLLEGKTLSSIEIKDDEITFIVSEDEKYKMAHNQNCCERVYVEEIIGDIEDIIASPVLLAEEVSYENEEPEGVSPKDGHYKDDSYTWTFYKLSTIKGSVTIRWLGESNGYYSESVDFWR